MDIKLSELGETIYQLKEELAQLKEQVKATYKPERGGMKLWEEITGLSKATFYQYKSTGKIPAHIYEMVGKKIVLKRSDLIKWNEAGRPTPAQIEAVKYTDKRGANY